MKTFTIVFAMTQYAISILIFMVASSDIQFIPAIIIFLNATNFIILANLIEKKSPEQK